jgi:hypothetical protein
MLNMSDLLSCSVASGCRLGGIMSGTEKKAEVGNKTSVGDLERVVKVRKYQHCEAEYAKLAIEPNTMPEVRDRYLRIAQYYRELAETEPAGARAASTSSAQ